MASREPDRYTSRPDKYTSSTVAIIAALEARRCELHMTAQQVAYRMGVEPGRVRRFETYTQKPSPRELQDWAAVLQCQLALAPVS